MEEEQKKVLEEAVGAMSRLVLWIADEIEPVSPEDAMRDLDVVYRVLVAAERCARRLAQKQRVN